MNVSSIKHIIESLKSSSKHEDNILSGKKKDFQKYNRDLVVNNK